MSRSILWSVLFVFGVVTVVSQEVYAKSKRDYDSIVVSGISPQCQDAHPKYMFDGLVTVAEQTDIVPLVSGQVTWVNPKAIGGGFIEKGEVILKVDAEDARTLSKIAKARWDASKANVLIQKGESRIAKIEFELGETDGGDKSLILREPQLLIAKSREVEARNNYNKSLRYLSRTDVIAPFSGYMESFHVGLGGYVIERKPVGKMFGSDYVFVDAEIKKKDIELLDLTEDARIYFTSGGQLEGGQIGAPVSILPRLKDSTQSFLLRIKAGFFRELSMNSLFINELVWVEVKGKNISNVVKVPRSGLVPGSKILVVNKSKKIRLEPIQVRFEDESFFYVDCQFAKKDIILIDHLKYVTPGEKLRLALKVIDPSAGDRF